MLLMLTALTLSTSCQKDKKKTTTPSTVKTDYLTKAPWNVILLRSSLDGVTWFDETSTLDACELDNTETFLKNFSGIIDEGPSKCDPSDPQTTDFNWSFNTDQTTLTVVDSFSSDILHILILDNTTLKVTSSENFGSVTYYAEITFAHL